MSSESPDERHAADAVGFARGRSLLRYENHPRGDDSLDYIDDLNEVYEMKTVTSQEFMELRNRSLTWFASTQLTMHWAVLVDVPTMDDKFRQMPNFPDDPDPETIAAIEADGFTLVRKAQREAEWREAFSGKKVAIPRIGKQQARELEDHLLVLELAGITDTREAAPSTKAELHAIWAIRRLTLGSICRSHPPMGARPGIEIKNGWSYSRTNDPNALAFRIQSWLDSDLSSNLRMSLRQTGFARRHGVLTFNSSEPEYWSAQEAGTAFLPADELAPPSEVDVLWCLIGSLLLRFEERQGWQSFDVPV